jgi:hypothetical protein
MYNRNSVKEKMNYHVYFYRWLGNTEAMDNLRLRRMSTLVRLVEYTRKPGGDKL